MCPVPINIRYAMTMNVTNKKKAVTVGILILVAYAVLASTMTTSKMVVVPAEIISGLAVIGIAWIMRPLFMASGKNLTMSYFVLKLIEGGLMVLVGLFFLFPDSALFELRDLAYLVHTYTFIVSAFVFYALLYKSKLIPQFISVWGLVSVVLLLAVNVLTETGLTIPIAVLIVGYVPIMLNEVFLAIWLMVKGFTVKGGV